MTLDETIKHAEEVADYDCYNEKQLKCADEHKQLAEWLRDYKRLKEQEAILDKIISEIEELDGRYVIGDYAIYGDNNIPKYVKFLEVLQIIDKYKTEREE